VALFLSKKIKYQKLSIERKIVCISNPKETKGCRKNNDLQTPQTKIQEMIKASDKQDYEAQGNNRRIDKLRKR